MYNTYKKRTDFTYHIHFLMSKKKKCLDAADFGAAFCLWRRPLISNICLQFKLESDSFNRMLIISEGM